MSTTAPITKVEEVQSTAVRLHGSCFCGEISFSCSLPPILKAYCHCTNCQRLTGCPFVHTVHIPEAAFTWTHAASAESKLDTFVIPTKNWKTRYRCRVCGVCVGSHNSQKQTWSVWGPTFARDHAGKIQSWELIKPEAHIFYGTRVLDVVDNLWKWEGYPNISARLG